MLSKNENNNIKKSTKVRTNGEQKILAIAMKKEGKSIASIAKELNKTRATIYSWLKLAPEKLSRNASRNRIMMDSFTASRIIELYVLLARPSVRELKERLSEIFAIKKTETQLRFFLKKRGLDQFKPSSAFFMIMNLKVAEKSSSKTEIDT